MSFDNRNHQSSLGKKFANGPMWFAFIIGMALFPITTPAFSQSVFQLNERGGKAYARGDYHQAVANYTSAITLSPDDAALYHNRGLAEIMLVEYDKAGSDFSKALSLDKFNPAIINSVGNLNFARKLYHIATSNFDLAVSLQPSNPTFVENRKRAWDAFRAQDEAIKRTTNDRISAVAVSPNNSRIWSGVDNWASKGGAHWAALLACQKISKDCQPVRLVVNQCIALSIRSNGYGSSSGATIDAARANAFQACGSEAAGCRVVYSGCSYPYVPPAVVAQQPQQFAPQYYGRAQNPGFQNPQFPIQGAELQPSSQTQTKWMPALAAQNSPGGCVGYIGPGGPCSIGPGGGLSIGPGGGLSIGPGGGLSIGPGGGQSIGPGGGKSIGPGGGLSIGPGGGLSIGPGGGLSIGPGGGLSIGPGGGLSMGPTPWRIVP